MGIIGNKLTDFIDGVTVFVDGVTDSLELLILITIVFEKLSCHPLGLRPTKDNISKGIKRHKALPMTRSNVREVPSLFTALVQ